MEVTAWNTASVSAGIPIIGSTTSYSANSCATKLLWATFTSHSSNFFGFFVQKTKYDFYRWLADVIRLSLLEIISLRNHVGNRRISEKQCFYCGYETGTFFHPFQFEACRLGFIPRIMASTLISYPIVVCSDRRTNTRHSKICKICW